MRKLIGAALAVSLATAGMAGPALAQPPADTEGNIKVFLRQSDEFVAAFERAKAEFAERYPNVTVEADHHTITTWGDYINIFLNEVGAGRAPDVMEIAIEGFLALSSKDLVIDQTELLAASDDPTLEDIAPALTTHMQSPLTGELNWFPMDWNGMFIWYNKDMFDEAGIPYPEDGWTWAEFLETAQALTITDDAGNTTQFGYRIPGYNAGLIHWWLNNGADKLDDTWTESTVSDPKFAESLEFLKTLVDEGVSPTYSAGIGSQEFNAGQVAMMTCGHWCTVESRDTGINAGVVYPPVRNEGDEAVAAFGIGGMGVLKSSPNPELALEFAKIFAGQEFQQDLSEAQLAIPSSRTWATTEEYLAYPDNSEIFYGSAEDNRIRPIQSPPNFADVEAIFMRHVENYVTGNADLETTIADMDAEMTRSMERAYR